MASETCASPRQKAAHCSPSLPLPQDPPPTSSGPRPTSGAFIHREARFTGNQRGDLGLQKYLQYPGPQSTRPHHYPLLGLKVQGNQNLLVTRLRDRAVRSSLGLSSLVQTRQSGVGSRLHPPAVPGWPRANRPLTGSSEITGLAAVSLEKPQHSSGGQAWAVAGAQHASQHSTGWAPPGAREGAGRALSLGQTQARMGPMTSSGW